MKRVREIAEAIAKLSPEEHRHLIEWFEEEHFKHAASARGEPAPAKDPRGPGGVAAGGRGSGANDGDRSGGDGHQE